MMYILYNSDGSIKQKFLNEYIQQGNNGTNVIFVAIDGYSTGNFTLSANVILPNGDVVALSGVSDTQTIGNVIYNGKKITLTSATTAIAGVIKVVIEANDVNVILATYPVILTVNETGLEATAPICITQSEYNNLLNSFLKLTGGTVSGLISALGGNFGALTINGNDVATKSWVGSNTTRLYRHELEVKLSTETNPRRAFLITPDAGAYTAISSVSFLKVINGMLGSTSDYPYLGNGTFMTGLGSNGAILIFGTQGQFNPVTTIINDVVVEL